MKYLFFIPARGGSKGIHKKNLKKISGHPLLFYTLREVLRVSERDSIFLSTDSQDILDYGALYGLTLDYQRPSKLSDDSSQVVDAVIDALDWLHVRNMHFGAVVVLQPTSPLRTAEDIGNAINFFEETQASSLLSVHKLEEHPFENIKMLNGMWNYCEKPENKVNKRQDYSNTYFHINGAIYIATVDFIREKRSLVEEGKSAIFVMPRKRGFDLDELDQIAHLEWLLGSVS